MEGGSAPPPGITISGNVHIGYGTSHVVLRHLRIRDNGYVGRSGSDCICITDGCRHIMVDHCSLEWARDEVVNPWGECSDITFQWCIFQGYGPHGYGPLNGGGIGPFWPFAMCTRPHPRFRLFLLVVQGIGEMGDDAAGKGLGSR